MYQLKCFRHEAQNISSELVSMSHDHSENEFYKIRTNLVVLMDDPFPIHSKLHLNCNSVA